MKPLALLIVLFCVSLALAQPRPASLWTRTLGTPGNDYVYRACQTADGGFALSGNANYTATTTNGYVVRLTATGDTLWTRIYPGSPRLSTSSLIQTDDHGFIFAGRVQSATDSGDAMIMRTDSMGTVIWQHTYGGADREGLNTVIKSTDNNFLAVGYSRSYGPGDYDFYLVKITPNGDTLWTRTLPDTLDQSIYVVQQPAEGGYVLAGVTGRFGTNSLLDILVVKTDEQGNVEWTRTYGGSQNESLCSICTTADGGYYIGAETNSFGAGGYDYYLIRTDRSGDTLWTRTYGYAGDDVESDVVATPDGGAAMVGTYYSPTGGSGDIMLWKTDSDGNSLWTQFYGTGVTTETGFGLCNVSGGGYLIAGSFYQNSSGNNYDAYMIRTGSDISPVDNQRLSVTPDNFTLTAYPNPFNPSTEITYSLTQSGEVSLVVYDLLGREISCLCATKFSPAGTHHLNFNASSLASGEYIVRLTAGDTQLSQKLILIR